MEDLAAYVPSTSTPSNVGGDGGKKDEGEGGERTLTMKPKEGEEHNVSGNDKEKTDGVEEKDETREWCEMSYIVQLGAKALKQGIGDLVGDSQVRYHSSLFAQCLVSPFC